MRNLKIWHGRIGSFDGRRFSEEMGSSGIHDMNEHRHMMTEIRSQNFEAIRFASYRLASKLRFVQKKTNLHLVDIWNIIEAFRENGFNTLDHHIQVGVTRLEALISGIYCQLNKRLPTTQQVNVTSCTRRLLSWMLFLYDANETCCLKVFSIKVSLVLLCAGKLTDKLRYLFSQISDANGHLIMSKFSEFLKDALALPAAVYESPTFSYSESMAHNIFDRHSKVTVNDFIDVIMSDSCPTLIWLPLLHRLASVEGVEHPVLCDGCGKNAFTGFRYKCQSCYNYQLCQECFWRGRVTRSHSLEHEMMEYATFKSTGKQLGHAIRKSFRCVPDKQGSEVPWFPETPERTLNLAHIVPPSPIPCHNGFPEKVYNYDMASINSGSTSRSPTKHNSTHESSQIDEEHRLIARYAARLAADANHAARSPSELSMTLDTSRAQRELIAQLEAKNREILREIARLHQQQDMEDQALHSQQNPTLLAELKVLRQRKEELEQHLSTLQESRRELMVQLEGLMKLLKSHQASPRSTPNSSPHSGSNRSLLGSFSRSAPTTPGCYSTNSDSLIGLGGDVRMAFGRSRSAKNLRSDLLVAADSVTSAMSSLVREFNSGDSDEDQSDHLDYDVAECSYPSMSQLSHTYRMSRSEDGKCEASGEDMSDRLMD